MCTCFGYVRVCVGLSLCVVVVVVVVCVCVCVCTCVCLVSSWYMCLCGPMWFYICIILCVVGMFACVYIGLCT